MTLNQIPLGEALRYIASQAGLKVKVEPYAVSIIPLSEQSNELTTREYRVPPGFISGTINPNASALSQGAYTKAPGTAAAPAGTGRTLRNPLVVSFWLIARVGANFSRARVCRFRRAPARIFCRKAAG